MPEQAPKDVKSASRLLDILKGGRGFKSQSAAVCGQLAKEGVRSFYDGLRELHRKKSQSNAGIQSALICRE